MPLTVGIGLYGDENKQGRQTKSRMLSVQYRMHEQIANWTIEAMYYRQLKTDESVRTYANFVSP
jgi:superfamily I DNA and/or RNA helicase